MTQKLFANDVTLEIIQIKPAIASPVGYMFASRGSTLVSPQQQRWVLYKEYDNKEASEIMLKVPELSSRQYTRLDDWKAAVESKGADGIWKEGATYVKAEATSSDTLNSFKDVMSTVKKLSPIVSRHLEGPDGRKTGATHPKGPGQFTVPPVPPHPYPQLIDRVSIWQNNSLTGYAFGTYWDPAAIPVDGQQENRESWVLLPGYQPTTYKSALTQSMNVVGGELETRIVDVEGTTASMQDFINDMIKVWQDGSTAISIVCSYYKESPASL